MQGFFAFRKRDAVVGSVLIVVTVSFYTYARYDITVKRSVLEERAAQHEQELLDGLDDGAVEHLVDVESGKAYGLFGKDWGVVRVYTRRTGDAGMETFIGVEYFYEQDGTGWQLADTASMKRPEKVIEGYRRFEEAGFTVDEATYLRYNR